MHMAESTAPMTSELLAQALDTNPVVMRRTMAGLRDAGIVRSEKGHGGGWTLLVPPEKLTLRRIYDALGMPRIFAMGNRSEEPECLVEQAVNRSMSEAFDAAEALLMKRLDEVTLAEIAEDARKRFAALPVETRKKPSASRACRTRRRPTRQDPACSARG